MDTSEQYIKMCEKAEEIQAQWQPAIGDWAQVKESVEWDGYHLCVNAGEVTMVLGIDERHYSDNPIVGDVDDIGLYPEGSWLGFDDTPKENLIWLPRQDQLQEMLPPIIPDPHFRYLLEEKTWYVTWMSGAQWEIYGSMEIIWLSIVMKLNYGKVWSGEEWLTSK